MLYLGCTVGINSKDLSALEGDLPHKTSEIKMIILCSDVIMTLLLWSLRKDAASALNYAKHGIKSKKLDIHLHLSRIIP